MKTIILFSSLLLLAACTRPTGESSTVNIQMPNIKTDFANSEKTVSAMSAGTRPTPTGFTGSNPINCYGVLVGGPEPEMSRNKCYRSDNSLPVRYIGTWAAGVPSGGNVSLEVPAGKDRVFYLIGFYSASGFCYDFKNNKFPDDANISNPYILGIAEKIQLDPGTTKEISLNATFTSTNYYDECKGPDFPENGGGSSNTLATNVAINKNWFPYNAFAENSCQSIDVRLTDANGKEGVLNAPTSMELKLNGSPVSVYTNNTDCGSSTNPQTSFSIPAGSSSANVIFRTISNSSISNYSVELSQITSNALTLPAAINFPNYATSDNAFEIDGPENILPNYCYKMKVMRKMTTGSIITSGAITLNYTSTAGATFSDATCSTSTTSGAISSGLSSTDVYFKATSTGTNKSILSVVDSGASYQTSAKTIFQGSGSSTPFALVIRGHTMGPANNICYATPYKAILVNEYQTAVPAVTPVVFYGNNASYYIYSDAGCSTGANSLGAGITINTGESYGFFYYKPMSASGTTYSLSLGTDNGSFPVSLPMNIYTQ